MIELLIVSPSKAKTYRITKDIQNIDIIKSEYGCAQDIYLCLDWQQETAVCCVQLGLEIREGADVVTGIVLSPGKSFSVCLDGSIEIMVLVYKANCLIRPARKYILMMLQNITIGSNPKNDIVIRHPFISSYHCELYMDNMGWNIRDNSSNGTYVNGDRIDKVSSLAVGDIIELFGVRIVFCGNFIGIIERQKGICILGTKLHPLTNGMEPCNPVSYEKKYFHRSPRNIKVPVMEQIVFDTPPMKQQMEKKPLLMLIGPTFTMMIPMVLGSVLAIYSYKSTGTNASLLMYTGIITAVASVVVGILWAFINLRYDKKKFEETETIRRESYAKYLKTQIEKIKSYGDEIRKAWEIMYKNPKDCLKYDVHSKELWNRNKEQEDYLTERIGLGTLDISEYIAIPKERFEIAEDELLQIPKKIKEEYSVIKHIPRGVDLGREGIVGIVGEGDKRKAFDIARVLIAQIAANNCYRDVKIALAYDAKIDGNEWYDYRFLPHLWADDYSGRFMAASCDEADDLFFELVDILREREDTEFNLEKKQYTNIVLFVSDISMLEGHAINKYITNDAEKYSFTVVQLANSDAELMNNTTYALIDSKEFTGIHRLKTDEREKLVFDRVSHEELRAFADRIATIKVNEDIANGGIPDSLTFFEMLGIQKLDELDVIKRWKTNKNYNSLKAAIGQTAGGKDCILDVHEKYHGPHGLVAGTTGSGKSETLQTYILSLAINYSPDDIGFFIIDYKGGGMANLFEGLPHMIGAISNLSGSAIKRAMVSIKSENQRRQRVFNEAGVNNINNYTKLVKAGEVELPVPHLFIIVDEFAELKREQPEFMKELISVAQVGRSLGVHLILSTQKPAGTVDENIWSNSKFKLCLRVQDKQDSKEMLHKEDAAFITQPGRGYLQVGNDEIYELFQSGWSGADYMEEDEIREDTKAAILSSLGVTVVRKKKEVKVKNSVNTITQLDAVKNHLKNMAEANGYNRNYSLWIPPLANPIFLEDICESAEEKEEYSLIATVGMYDDPAHQNQAPYRIDFAKNGNIAVCGTNVSGKSTFLQTLITSLIMKYTADEVNIYIADFSNKSLRCFQQAPQIGGVVCEDDEERIRKLIFLLNRFIRERKESLGGVSFNAYKRTNHHRMPAVVLVIDNYGGFREKTNEQYDNDVVKITHDGAAYGIFTVFTANGFSNSGIPGRIEDNVSEGIALLMNEKYLYSSILRTGRVEIEPEDLKGRGLVKVDGEVREFQSALAIKEKDELLRLEKTYTLCKTMGSEWYGARAIEIPEIPEKPTWNIFRERDDVKSMCGSKYMLPLGYEKVSAEAYGIDLRRTYCYLIAGQARTGKKNAMKIMIQAAAMRGADIIIIEHGSIEFKILADDVHARYLYDEETQAEYFTELVPEFVERNKRKNQLKEQGVDEEEIYSMMRQFKETYIFITDIGKFMETLYQPADGITKIVPFVENIAEKGGMHNIYLVAVHDNAESSECRGYRVYDAMTGYHTGIQLGGNAANSTFFDFSNLSFTEQNQSQRLGIGMIPKDNDDREVTQIVIPQYRRLIQDGKD